MGYEIALNKAWDEIRKLSSSSRFIVRFLTDTYEVNVSDGAIILQSSLLPSEEDLSVLILHYLIGMQRHGYRPSGEWISFKDIWGGDTYFPAYRNNTIGPLIERLQKDPEGLIKNLIEHYKGRVVEGGDVAVELATFPDVLIRVIMWKGDEELLPEAIILFDRSLTDILVTEDIAALLYFIVYNIIS